MLEGCACMVILEMEIVCQIVGRCFVVSMMFLFVPK